MVLSHISITVSNGQQPSVSQLDSLQWRSVIRLSLNFTLKTDFKKVFEQ